MYKLIYSCHEFLVVSKSSGVCFHSTKDNKGLCSIIKEKEGLSLLYPVHRLDNLTSGLIIFAKNKKSAKTLSILFQNQQIEKYYISLSNKKPKKRQGQIIGDMQKSRRSSWKLLRSKVKPAKTCFFSKAYGEGLRLFVVKPLTGKTHQIRVAMKSIGSPVLGDNIYSRIESGNFDRGYLHAYVLKFNYKNKPFCFIDKPDEGLFFKDKGFLEALDDFTEPWDLNWPKKK